MHGSRRRFLLLVAALALGSGPGCTRQFFRERADKDVAGVLTQKNIFPAWRIGSWHVYPDPMARFADPTRPDRPPYPPDDFAARMLSPNPQRPGKKAGAGRVDGEGYYTMLEHWDAENRAAEKAANPDAQKQPLPPPKPLKDDTSTAPRAIPGFAQYPGPKPWSGSAPPAGSAARPGPTITEVREPGVVIAVGEVQDGNRMVPAVALIPTSQPPEKLPNPEKMEPPKKNPPEKGKEEGTPAVVLTGDYASDYLKALATNETGYRIKLEQAVELGVINSREFQDRREDLYLAALPVTLERFNFAAQAFMAETIIRESLGKEAPNGPQNRWRFGTDTSLSKLFPTGAVLLVRLANQFVVDLSGSHPNTAVSNLSLSLAQPFLRGGGYAVTLEPLTQAERNMVYAVRSYARFRKLFYVAVSAGGDFTNNPYGLQGLSVNLGRGIGGNLTAPRSGYLPLLLQAAILANQQKNITALEQLLQLYVAFREGGQQSDLQVMQVEQQLLSSRTTMLGSSISSTSGGGGGGGGGLRGFLDTLDNFKLQLGLPLTVGLDLDNSPLRPIREQLARFEQVYEQVRDVEQAARQYDPAAPVAGFRQRWRMIFTESPLVRGTEFAKTIGPAWATWEKRSDEEFNKEIGKLYQERRALLDRKADRQLKGLPEPEAEVRRLNELDSAIDLAEFERAVRFYVSQPWLREKTEAARASVQAAAFRDVFNTFYQVILEARNERLQRTRQQWPKLPTSLVNGADMVEIPLDDAYTAGIQLALSQRLDLMNARALVVDAWRQIAVQANSLQGVFNVQYNLNSTTPPNGGNPAAFSGPRSTSLLTFHGELPLVRRVERNNYRAALISYQRQRRTVMAFEDNIANDIRADIRELRTIAELYRIQQRLIELGYAQVDNAQAILLAPPAPGAQSDAGSAAALTNQVLQAQQSLVNAQNTLYTIWVNYLVSRMTLYLDLELMQVDERGVWCDELIPGTDDSNRPGTEPGRPEREPAGPRGERLPPPQPAPGADPQR